MSPSAQRRAILLEYDAPLLHCLIEAIARDTTQSLPQTPMVAPRLPKACAELLRKSWSELPETFTKEVFDRLAEDKEVYELLSSGVVRQYQNMRKVISRFLGFLEPEAACLPRSFFSAATFSSIPEYTLEALGSLLDGI